MSGVDNSIYYEKIKLNLRNDNSLEMTSHWGFMNLIAETNRYLGMIDNNNKIDMLKTPELYYIVYNMKALEDIYSKQSKFTIYNEYVLSRIKNDSIIFTTVGSLVLLFVFLYRIFLYKYIFESINKVFNLLIMIPTNEMSNLYIYINNIKRYFDMNETHDVLQLAKRQKRENRAEKRRGMRVGKPINMPVVKVFIYNSLLFVLVILAFIIIMAISDVFSSSLKDLIKLREAVDNDIYIKGSDNFIFMMDYYSKEKNDYSFLAYADADLQEIYRNKMNVNTVMNIISTLSDTYSTTYINLLNNKDLCDEVDYVRYNQESLNSLDKAKCKEIMGGSLRFGILGFLMEYYQGLKWSAEQTRLDVKSMDLKSKMYKEMQQGLEVLNISVQIFEESFMSHMNYSIEFLRILLIVAFTIVFICIAVSWLLYYVVFISSIKHQMLKSRKIFSFVPPDILLHQNFIWKYLQETSSLSLS